MPPLQWDRSPIQGNQEMSKGHMQRPGSHQKYAAGWNRIFTKEDYVSCNICGNKMPNCDCTSAEREMHEKFEDLCNDARDLYDNREALIQSAERVLRQLSALASHLSPHDMWRKGAQECIDDIQKTLDGVR